MNDVVINKDIRVPDEEERDGLWIGEVLDIPQKVEGNAQALRRHLGSRLQVFNQVAAVGMDPGIGQGLVGVQPGGLIGQLEEKEKEIIVRRYFENQTQTQVAQALGVSQVQISRLEKKILKQMRARL